MSQGLIDRLSEQVGDRGLAISILRKRGHVEQDSEELTSEGRERDSLGAAGRAIDRAAKIGGGKFSDYKYNPKTNRATKR